MNSTKERVFLNLLVGKFKKYNIENLTKVPDNCVRVVYNFKYDKCIITIPGDILIGVIPKEIIYMKKFIRKISYSMDTKIFSIIPCNDEFCKIIYKK